MQPSSLPKFGPWDPQGAKREPGPASCPLTYTNVLLSQHVHLYLLPFLYNLDFQVNRFLSSFFFFLLSLGGVVGAGSILGSLKIFLMFILATVPIQYMICFKFCITFIYLCVVFIRRTSVNFFVA